MLQADASDEGGVIYDSAVALSQGLWPISKNANTTLSNGTTVTAPLGGYQYIPGKSQVKITDGWGVSDLFICQFNL